MSAEAPQFNNPQTTEAVLPLPQTNLDRLIADASEYPALQTTVFEQEEQGAHITPEVFEFASTRPSNIETAIQQPETETQNVSAAIKDLYYWAGAKYTVLTTMGEASNSPVLVNVNSLKRRQKVALGLGIMACAKFGLDIVKAGYGLHSSFQADLINDMIPVELPEGSVQGKVRVSASEVVDTTIDYTYQGLEAATNALLQSPQKRRKVPKHKAPATSKPTE